MKITILIISFLSLILLFNSCNNDFDLYEDYRDISIVYCIADIADDTTWVKITKAFRGPGNVLLSAQNPDSSNYPYKLDATLTGVKNGEYLEPMVLDTMTIHNKEISDTIITAVGDTLILNPFYAPNQLVYYAVGKLDKDAEYKLSINKNNGETLVAESGVVDEFDVTYPYRRIVFKNNVTGSIEWLTAKNGARYIVTVRFNYSEYASGYSDTVQKSIDWFLRSFNSKTINGGEVMEAKYNGADFFNLLENNIPPIANVERWVEDVEIEIVCGSRVLVTYLDINSSEAAAFEEVPTYSNIDGGAGIFASRHVLLYPIPLGLSSERDIITKYNLGFKYKQ